MRIIVNKLIFYLNKINKYHIKFHSFIAEKSKTNIWYTIILLLYILWEIAELILIPGLFLLLGYNIIK